MTRGRRSERGIALFLVLWVFMILGVIALDFAKFMRDDARASINFADEAQGYYAALAGMNRALFDLQTTREDEAAASPGGRPEDLPGLSSSDDTGPLVPPDGDWHDGEFAGAKWAVRMTDQGGLIPINRPKRELLKTVVRNLSLGPGAATAGTTTRADTSLDVVVDSILDWLDRDDLARPNGAEIAYYQKLRVPYGPKNGFFDTPEELLMVRGVTADLFYGHDGMPGLRDVITVFALTRDEDDHPGQVNLRSTTAPVLQALLGVSADDAADLISQRDDDGLPLQPAVQARNPALAPFLGEWAPKLVLIEAKADTTRDRNVARIAAVAALQHDEPARILRWFDRAPWSGVIRTPALGDQGAADS
jgi:general secretion pathway protein K